MNLLPPPGPERTRQLALLGVLTIVLAVFFWYRYWPATATTAAPASKIEGKATDKDKLPLPDAVALASLVPAPDSAQLGRNPFRFGQPPPPPTPPAPPPVVYVPPPPMEPPPPAGPPPIPLKLFGVEVLKGKRLAHLTDPDGAIFPMKAEGDIIDGKYKLVKVNADSVVLSYLNGTGMKTVYIER